MCYEPGSGAVHVRNSTGGMIVNYERITDFPAEEAKRALEDAEKGAEIFGISVAPHLAWGDPSEEILRCAEEIDTDSIVVGSAGKRDRY